MEVVCRLLQAMPYPAVFIVGLAIRLLVGMRQFNRRGVGGLQHFDNYFVGLVTLFMEWVLKRTAYVLMLWGLIGWLLR